MISNRLINLFHTLDLKRILFLRFDSGELFLESC